MVESIGEQYRQAALRYVRYQLENTRNNPEWDSYMHTSPNCIELIGVAEAVHCSWCEVKRLEKLHREEVQKQMESREYDG